MEKDRLTKQSFILGLVVIACFFNGIVGLAFALVNENPTGLIASSIAFASLLYFFKNENSK